MSLLSTKLKELIDRSGTTVYKLAQKADVERTTIHKCIAGNRIPPFEFIQKISDALLLSPAEKRELTTAYHISKTGEDTYYRRMKVKDIIEKLSATARPMAQRDFIATPKDSAERSFGSIRMHTGGYAVDTIVKEIIDHEVCTAEQPSIDFVVNMRYPHLFDLLYQYHSRMNVNMRHIIRLSKLGESYAFNNLELLSDILPLAMVPCDGYTPYYYYESDHSEGEMTSPFPYYIITGSSVILLARDLKSAITATEPYVVSYFHSFFERSLEKSNPLMSKMLDASDILAHFIEDQKYQGCAFNFIEFHPCFAKWYDYDLAQAKVRAEIPNREDFIKMVLARYTPLFENPHPSISVFCVEGLRLFAEEGILPDLPAAAIYPFTVPERIKLLKTLREMTVQRKYYPYIINQAEFAFYVASDIPYYLSITTYDGQAVNFANYSYTDQRARSIFITEPGIVDAFCDFVNTLDESRLVYGQAETLKILDKFIKECEQKL